MSERKAGRIAPGFPALYAAIYSLMVEVGHEHGYAMALHGSPLDTLERETLNGEVGG
jgi:hypothetical protein